MMKSICEISATAGMQEGKRGGRKEKREEEKKGVRKGRKGTRQERSDGRTGYIQLCNI